MGEREHRGPSAWQIAKRLVLGVVLIGMLVVGGTAFRVWQVGRADDRSHADAIVVLGAAQYSGKPSPLLEARLEHAKQLWESGVADRIVTGGGSAKGDTYTEADAGALWLIEQGVPQNRLIPVGEGRDTLGTLRAVHGEMQERGMGTAVLVSDPWHSLRLRNMASYLGLEAWCSPTHSGPVVQTREIQARYVLRETAALLYYRLSKEPAGGGNGLG